MSEQFTLTGEETGFWFVSQLGKLWLPNGEIPNGSAKELNVTGMTAQVMGEWQGQQAWLIAGKTNKELSSIRPLLHHEDESLFLLAGKAVQLAEFYRSHQFCGYCGKTMYWSKTEWCCLCSHCKERYYPQISPSVIVGIRHKNKILLAKHNRHNADNLYTVLAGFVEVGETLEQAVMREVYEESKIKIKNIRYVTSQPWPFPNSIMTAYLADYDEGEIKVDPSELVEADWYHYSELPKIPEYGTVARRLIEDTIVLCREYEQFGEE